MDPFPRRATEASSYVPSVGGDYRGVHGGAENGALHGSGSDAAHAAAEEERRQRLRDGLRRDSLQDLLAGPGRHVAGPVAGTTEPQARLRDPVSEYKSERVAPLSAREAESVPPLHPAAPLVRAHSMGTVDSRVVRRADSAVPLSKLVSDLEKLQATVDPSPRHGRRRLGGDDPPRLPREAYGTAAGARSGTGAGSGSGGGVPGGAAAGAGTAGARSGARTRDLLSGMAAVADLGVSLHASRPLTGARGAIGGGDGSGGAAGHPPSGAGHDRAPHDSVKFAYSDSEDEAGGGAVVPVPAPPSPHAVARALLDDILKPRANMVKLLCWRTAQLRVARSMWARSGVDAALSHVLSTANDGVAVDFLNAVVRRGCGFPKWPESDLKWVELLVPFLCKVLRSHFEDYVVTSLAAVRVTLDACTPLVHEVCAEQESMAPKPVPSWAAEAQMERPKKKSNDFIIKEARVADLAEAVAALRKPLEGVFRLRGQVGASAKRCIHQLRELLRGVSAAGLL